MERFIEILKNNPILLILLGGWLLSMLGNVLTKAARKQQQPAQRTPRPPQAGPRRAPQEATPDEIAEEIRRMMGLDRPKPVARPAPPPPERVEVVVEEAEAEPSHGGNLAAELARKEAERKVRTRSRIGDRSAELGSAIRDRYREEPPAPRPAFGIAPGAVRKARPPRRAGALFDASDPMRAIVALEVLGAPRGLRPWEGR